MDDDAIYDDDAFMTPPRSMTVREIAGMMAKTMRLDTSSWTLFGPQEFRGPFLRALSELAPCTLSNNPIHTADELIRRVVAHPSKLAELMTNTDLSLEERMFIQFLLGHEDEEHQWFQAVHQHPDCPQEQKEAIEQLFRDQSKSIAVPSDDGTFTHWACWMALLFTMKERGTIYFLLDGLDVHHAFTPGTQHHESFTSKELQFLQQLWHDKHTRGLVEDYVRFYRQGELVEHPFK